MSPTLGIYWINLGFINNYKESQLRLIILRYNADVASVFSWIVTKSAHPYKILNKNIICYCL